MSHQVVEHNSKEAEELPWINSGLYAFPRNESNSFQTEKSQAINLSYSKVNQNYTPSSEEVKKPVYLLNSPVMPRKEYSLPLAYNQSTSGKSFISNMGLKSFMYIQNEHELEVQRKKWECSKNIPCLFKVHPRVMPRFPSNPYGESGFQTKGSIQYENVSQEKSFIINLYIETKNSHLGPFPFEIHPKTNLRLLKLQVEKELDIPASFQNWILNRTLDIDFDVPLVDYGVIPKSSIFLYVDANYKKPLNEKGILELLKMRNSSVYRKNSASVPCQSVHDQFVKNTHKNTDEIVTDVKTEVCQTSSKNIPNPQTCQVVKKFTNANLSRRFDDSVKCSSTETDCKVSSNNSTPKSSRKTYKVGRFINEQRKNSNSSDKELKDLNEFKKTVRKNLTCSFDGLPVVSPCLNDVIKPALKENDNLTRFNDLPLVVANRIEVDSGSTANCTELVNSQFSGDLTDVNVKNCEPILKRKDSKNSILKQIRDIHKSKFQPKAFDYHEKEQRFKSAETLNEQSSVIDIISNPEINPDTAHIEKFQHIGTVHNYPNNMEMETKPVNISINSQLSETYATSINNDSLAIAVDVVEGKAEDLSSSFVAEANSLEGSDKAITKDFNSTIEHVIPDISSEMCGDSHSNGGSEFEQRGEVKEPLSEIYIECLISKEEVNELQPVNAEEPEELHEDVNKESAENYDFLLRMENLNLVKNVINFTCPICFGEFESDQGVVLHECLHTFCMDCLARAVDYAEEALVKCPYRDEDYSCQSYLQQREIKSLVSAEVYEKYLQKSITTAESLAEKSFHCKTPDCPGWCMFEDNINVFRCPVCFHYNCLNCQAIHEGLNCRQYQDKLKKEVKLDRDSEKTLEFLNKMIEGGKAMKCPKCDLIVMKKWGCDWLKCCICQTEICWITKGPRWGPAGQGDTSAGCRCGVNGKKCHPSCTYCH